MFPFDKLERLEELAVLDPVVAPLRKAVTAVVRPQAVSDTLHGTWLGHPLHPVLVHVTIGSFASAALLDLAGGGDAEDAADLLALTGLASAVPAALAGATDWASSNPQEQRTGLVHALANAVGLGCWVASLLARRKGERGRGTALGLAGLAAIGAGADPRTPAAA